MDLSNQILSEITVHMKYARYLENKQRRETWDELVTRNMNMHLKKFPELELQILKAYKQVIYELKDQGQNMHHEIVGGQLSLGDGTKLPLSKATRAGDFLFLSGQLALGDDGQLKGTDIFDANRTLHRKYPCRARRG